jgi:hypothetical protein
MNTALHQLPRLDVSSPHEPFFGRVVIRLATAGDRCSLERLAQLDSTDMPLGPVLIGELRERPVAALSLGDGKVVADPFVATGEIVELLRLRARQLDRPRRLRSLRLQPLTAARAIASTSSQ